MKKQQSIFIACPWTPKGGGMYKVADYMVQAQSTEADSASAKFMPLDTRGDKNAAFSMLVLFSALVKVAAGRFNGSLKGVHVNMAERLSLFRKGTLIAFCKLLGVPVVLHLHAAQLHHFYRALPAPIKAITRWFFSISSHCIVLGEAAKSFVVNELKVPAEKVSIVINGVPRANVARRQRSPSEPFRVLFLGNLSERKGVSDLLNAFSKIKGEAHLPASNLYLAGGGDIDKYTLLAKELGIAQRVHFEGWCNQDKASLLLASADVLVLPSYDEGLPLVILEALSQGVAVICTPVGEIPSVLTHSKNALFVQPGDIAGLATTLADLINDDDLRNSLEVNGREIYEQKFSIKKFFNDITVIHQQYFGAAAALKKQLITEPKL